MGRKRKMVRTVGIGIQDFEAIIQNSYFYVDKTTFIREWWENGDAVTLITRPRRFGKTLTMDMVRRFFSVEYAGKGEVFAAGNLSGDFFISGQCKGNQLHECAEKDLSAID